jgi:diguanylate cyclase (GGDEF)-like protein
MRWPLQLSHVSFADWFDWQRRDGRDAVVILSIAILAYVAGHIYQLPPKLFKFAIDYADTEIDDVIFVVFVMSVAMMAYALRRYQDLSREIKARISAELEARDLARHDPLTGLPNRRLFVEKLDEYLRSTSDTQRLAVLMLDLDGFKKVNDMHGHATGDKALTEFAHRVAVLLRADSVLARIGGDEFAIVMPKINSLDDPTNLARRIAAAVAQPFVIDNSAAEFDVGVGIAIAPNDGTDLDELVRRADRPMSSCPITSRWCSTAIASLGSRRWRAGKAKANRVQSAPAGDRDHRERSCGKYRGCAVND